MSVFEVIGLLSTVALFSPVVIILAKRLIHYRCYFILFIYCLLSFIYNLMTQEFVPVPKNIERGWGLMNNLLDVPLMMTFLLLFGKSPKQKKIMMILTIAFVCFEAVIVSLYGVSVKHYHIMGPGLALVLLFSISFFIHRVKISITHQKAAGKAVMAAAILFAYGCFSLIYIIHYILALPQVNEIFLLYFIATIVYSTTLSIGLIIEHKRIKKLQELQVTRKELMEFFGESDPATPKKDIADSWRFN
ncbi:MAG: hypothetical protein HC867_03505 [Bacteroidia bacterium]|nr:hypothetical protein [Bacteroidia bacterium]